MQKLPIHRSLGCSIGYHVTCICTHQRLQCACVQELSTILGVREFAVVCWDFDEAGCACCVHAQGID
eukprot:15144903-Alexandrium_andersonii.AAC.1